MLPELSLLAKDHVYIGWEIELFKLLDLQHHEEVRAGDVQDMHLF